MVQGALKGKDESGNIRVPRGHPAEQSIGEGRTTQKRGYRKGGGVAWMTSFTRDINLLDVLAE